VQSIALGGSLRSSRMQLTMSEYRNLAACESQCPLHRSSVSCTRSAIAAGSSLIANATVRSKPCGPVMSTRNPPLKGSAEIHASCAPETCLPPATMAASIRSRRLPGMPLMSNEPPLWHAYPQ
jgi:hypothetical protein